MIQTKLKIYFRSFGWILLSAFLLSLMTACGPGSWTNDTLFGSKDKSSSSGEESSYPYSPLLWESARTGTEAWSAFVFRLIRTEGKVLLEAQDFNRFCSNYEFLSVDQKVNVAGQLVSAIVKYESRFNPLSRYHESTMGTDPVTGAPVYSEGLMQLSYQDALYRPYCKFDWEKDQKLDPEDPSKTILDPSINLDCGVRILISQIQKQGRIVISSGAYWSVIKEGSTYEKIDEIAALVNQLPFCQ